MYLIVRIHEDSSFNCHDSLNELVEDLSFKLVSKLYSANHKLIIVQLDH